ncbi:MAG TPA: aryl-sulfate sulfotransferase [Planctomycetaceae bacterium]|nr:aryl-sulfate sulfotransferase [Planctomycetaceae bacterium]
MILSSSLGCDSAEPPGEPVRAVESVAEYKRTPLLAGVPAVRPNPNEDAPLVALVDVEAEEPVVVALEIDDGDRKWTWRPRMIPAREQSVVLLGMRPNRQHSIVVRVENPGERTYDLSEPITFETPPLPKSFPPLQTTVSNPDRMEPGVTLFPVNIWVNDVDLMDFGYLMILDAAGEVVWYLKTGHRTATVQILDNGHLLYNHAGYRRMIEINLLGDVVREWHAANIAPAPNADSIPIACDTLHHEILPIEDGKFLALSTRMQNLTDFRRNLYDEDERGPVSVVGDEIVEFQSDGKVLRRLNLFDILDIDRLCYGVFGNFWNNKYLETGVKDTEDWTHANAIMRTTEKDWIVVSLRHQDCLIKLNFTTGEIRWILGDHDGWDEPWKSKLLAMQGDWDWPYHQHGPQITSRGTIMMFDNGNYRAIPPELITGGSENYSRVLELKVDEENMTVSKVWEYRGKGHEEFYSPFYGEADVLPQTGNILVTDGGHIEFADGRPSDIPPSDHQWARVFEITYDTPAEILWEVRLETPVERQLGWSVYRSERIESLEPFAEKLQAEVGSRK